MSEFPLAGQLTHNTKPRDRYKIPKVQVPYQDSSVFDPYQHVHVSENEIKDIDYTFAPEKEISSAEELEPFDLYNDVAFELKEVDPHQVVTLQDDEVLTTPANFHQVNKDVCITTK